MTDLAPPPPSPTGVPLTPPPITAPYSFGAAFSFRQYILHVCGGARQNPSAQTNAQTFGMLFLGQFFGFMQRHPTVCVSDSPGWMGVKWRSLTGRMVRPPR